MDFSRSWPVLECRTRCRVGCRECWRRRLCPGVWLPCGVHGVCGRGVELSKAVRRVSDCLTSSAAVGLSA